MCHLRVVVLSLLVGSATSQADTCKKPVVPSLPDGSSASMSQMLQGQEAVQRFQAANLRYMGCIEKQISAAQEAGATAPDEASKAAAKAAQQQARDAYHTAVSEDEDVAGRFDAEYRKYQAANPG